MGNPAQNPADSRDMIVPHVMFRRELAAAPALVRAVAAGDTRRTAVLAEHVTFLVAMLHAHHESEDRLVWPKLHERGARDIEPLVEIMEQQHAGIDKALQQVEAMAAQWAATAAATDRDVLAGAIDDLLEPMAEHLDLEEAKVLSLVDKYLTEQEWKETVAASMAKVPVGKRPLIFGMGTYDASAETLQILKNAVPALAWLLFAWLGRRAYASYAQRVYGTPTPPHFR